MVKKQKQNGGAKITICLFTGGFVLDLWTEAC